MSKIKQQSEEAIKKYELDKNYKEPLKIFFGIVRPEKYPPIPTERAIGVVAYKPEEAVKKANAKYRQPGFRLIFYGSDHILLNEVLNNVNLEGKVKEVVKEVSPKPSKKQFIYNLKLFADKFVKSDKDKKKLKKIINKIK